MFLVRHHRMLSKDSKTHDQKYLFMTYWSQNDGGGQSVKPKALKGAMHKKKLVTARCCGYALDAHPNKPAACKVHQQLNTQGHSRTIADLQTMSSDQ